MKIRRKEINEKYSKVKVSRGKECEEKEGKYK